jgi:HlyD family secretion protein
MKKRSIWIISIVVIITTVVILKVTSGEREGEINIQTYVVKNGNLSNTITATGTVEPIEKVEIGTQVSGIIEKIYVDFNSTVEEGQLLAELDKLTLKSRLSQAKANLESAENEMDFQEKNYKRIKMLFEEGSVSETELESAEYKYRSAKASYSRLKSELELAKVNLSYADIVSPISGTVISRNVEEGQTVASSLNTPTLFYIARDLTKMQVEADVDEADIGTIQEGQKVIFTVDAYPDDEFEGTVKQKRIDPQVTANVVTYTVVIDAPNPDLKLLPGLTASISIITEGVDDVLTIPSSALIFQPDEQLTGNYEIIPLGPPNEEMKAKREEMRKKIEEMKRNGSFDPENRPFPPGGNGRDGKDFKAPSFVWVKSENKLEQRLVRTGISDGINTEIKRGLKDGDTIVVSVKTISESTNKSTEKSPFMPQMPGRGKR